MWIVKLALRRPYTFVVMALLILVLGGLSIISMSTDIFPTINIPVVTVLWQYGGLTPDDMATRITTYSEYVTSSTVDNIRSIESQTLSGISVIKVFLQPGANVDGAIAQLASISQTVLRFMPPGTQPPFILRYNASSVPILQLSLSSPTWSESQLYDYGLYRVRQALAPIQGLMLPLPYGGKPRQIMVDLDPQALLAKGLSPNDVSAALTAQNLTLPSGTAKMGTRDYIVSLNSSPSTIAALNEVPIKQVNGATVYVRDIGHVRDGFDVQTNIVRQDGRRSVLLTILLSLLVSVMTLSLLGQTLNVMTLGGLALAVGIVVDDTTVELENVHRNASQGKGLIAAILDGAQQIAAPAFVSTLAICIVFVPVVLLTGPAKFLFTPMALAVVVAVLASYLLSRTIIPTLVRSLLAHELAHQETAEEQASASPHGFTRLSHAFTRGFERLRERYSAALARSLAHRLWVCVAFVGVLASAAVLV